MPRERSRSRSRSRERHKSRRHDSRERDHKRKHSRSHGSSERRHDDRHDAKRSRHASRSPEKPSQPSSRPDIHASERPRSPAQQVDAEAEKKRLRQEKLAAWKSKQATEATQAQPAAPAPEPSAGPDETPAAKAAWTPWDDPNIAAAPASVSAAAPAPAPPPVGPPTVDSVLGYARVPEMPKSVAKLRAKFEMEEQQQALRKQLGKDEPEEDPLDAFMAAEILPEVKAKQEAERLRKDEERRQKAALLAEGKPLPKEKIVADSDSDEETPDEEFEIPAHKVKLMIGAGGEKIKFIQRKTKCRIQVKKDEKELEKGFGQGPTFQLPVRGVQKTEDGAVKMVTIMLFGDRDSRRKARELIDEALDNREQKAQQRHQQAERKREAKARDRQMYHLRHTRDYEALEVPIGSDKATIKKAYRNLAKIWHPDKHPDNQEEAKIKFQEIARAFESLMTTDEDAQILSLGGNTAAEKKAAQRQAAAAGVRMRPEAM